MHEYLSVSLFSQIRLLQWEFLTKGHGRFQDSWVLFWVLLEDFSERPLAIQAAIWGNLFHWSTASTDELSQCLRIFPNLKITMVSHAFNLYILLPLKLKINSYVCSGICISSFVYCLPGIFFLCSIEKIKCSDLRVRRPGFKFQLLHLLAEHPWTSY